MENRAYVSVRRMAKFALLVWLATGLAGVAPRHGLAKYPLQKNGNPNPRILPPNSHPFGMTYGGWSAAWWQYVYSLPVHDPNDPTQFFNPIFDETGVKCGVEQSGPVFFLMGVSNVSGTATRDQCTVPAGKALFFPILNTEWDNVPNNTYTVDQLYALAAADVGSASGLHASVDGVPVTNLRRYRAMSPVFTYTVPATDNFYQFFGLDFAGSVYPAVSDGFWLMLAPLPPGRHTIKFGGTFENRDFTLDVTYHLRVAAGNR
jgi:hypothetical protein